MSLPPISFTGVSEFADDFQVILERAFEVATLPISGLQTEQTLNLAQQQQLGGLAAAVQSLESEFVSLGTKAQDGAITTSSSDTDVATVTITGSASPVDIDLNVTSAAAVAQETTTHVLPTPGVPQTKVIPPRAIRPDQSHRTGRGSISWKDVSTMGRSLIDCSASRRCLSTMARTVRRASCSG